MDTLLLMAAAGLALFNFTPNDSNSARILESIMGSSSATIISDPSLTNTLGAFQQYSYDPSTYQGTFSRRGWGFYSDESRYSCVGTAVVAREQELLLAHSTNSYMVAWAHQQRASALVDAYSQSNTALMRSAVRTAWKTFESSFRLAEKDLKNEQKAAWLRYNLAVKACGANARSISDVSIAGSSVRGVGGAGAPGGSGGYGAYGSYGESGSGASDAASDTNSGGASPGDPGSDSGHGPGVGGNDSGDAGASPGDPGSDSGHGPGDSGSDAGDSGADGGDSGGADGGAGGEA